MACIIPQGSEGGGRRLIPIARIRTSVTFSRTIEQGGLRNARIRASGTRSLAPLAEVGGVAVRPRIALCVFCPSWRYRPRGAGRSEDGELQIRPCYHIRSRRRYYFLD